MFRTFRKWFFSGLLVVAPIGVTLFVIIFLMDKVAVPARNLMFPGDRISELTTYQLWGLNIFAFATVLSFVMLLGWLSQLVIGRWIVLTFERIVGTVPVVRTVYNTVKQIRDTFVQQQKAVFQKTVLLEYPRKGVWVLGFLTGTGRGEIQEKTEADLVNIFVPTTPNPTSGFLLMVPIVDVKFLEMSVSDGMKLIISGGAVVPSYPPEKKPELPENDATEDASPTD
jgi:uncharacterized membrane protein|tara:strand:- start:972 stop:1649 length:678 start_codon:yes stop_codon:yes gene_type:complete